MIKYYFIGYSYQTKTGFAMSSCLCKVEDKTLREISEGIAKTNGITPDSVVITYLKDLSRMEYEMLKGKSNDN